MGGTISFPINDDLKKIVAHTRQHGQCKIPYSDPREYSKEPSLFLVKDQGIYLMSASDTPCKVEGENLVVHAKGFDPDKDEFGAWWHNAREICGGDDFVEGVDLKIFEQAIAGGAKTVKVRFRGTAMELSAVVSRRC